MNISKVLPYLLAVVALITLWLNYQQWSHMKKDCDCGKEQPASPIP